jgi:transcriptional regulator with XRE-family HTH domain
MGVDSRAFITMPGLRRQRQMRGLTIEQLCNLSGLYPGAIRNAEKGNNILVSTARLIIAALEQVPLSDTAREVFHEKDTKGSLDVQLARYALGLEHEIQKMPNGRAVIDAVLQKTHVEKSLLELINGLGKATKMAALYTEAD